MKKCIFDSSSSSRSSSTTGKRKIDTGCNCAAIDEAAATAFKNLFYCGSVIARFEGKVYVFRRVY